ncbi:hypothetical protein ATY75_29610 [Rhizobium sp. N122]|nr:hypothetical protein ATY75_29610 [Rhizobium sp. N122]
MRRLQRPSKFDKFYKSPYTRAPQPNFHIPKSPLQSGLFAFLASRTLGALIIPTVYQRSSNEHMSLQVVIDFRAMTIQLQKG